MPGHGDIFGKLFGVNVRFTSDRRDALDAAITLCPPGDAPERGANPAISVTLKVLPPGGEALADSFCVAKGCLTLSSGGFVLRADGGAGEGSCLYPAGTAMGPDTPFAGMVNTLLLFLVAHAGRTPLHASAVMLGDTALVLAGKSGSGKSSLALAADRAGLAILSDDTIYVQTAPDLRIWAQPRAIHVFEKDAPANAVGSMRYRSGRWKRALPIATVRPMAERTVLCVLDRGDTAALQPLDVEQAVAILTQAPEPGYEFYGARSAEAVRELARGGCWRLTLSADPKDAIDLLRRAFASQVRKKSFHNRYTSLVEEIERAFPVECWRLDDIPLWPLARFGLYVDIHRAMFGDAEPRQRSLLLRVGAALARPLINRWRARHDPVHQLHGPQSAHAILLGDGVSLDAVDGAYQDRFGEPVIAALECAGKKTFVMQPGDLSRLPWRRATFATSVVEARAFLASLFRRTRPHLPQHARLMKFLALKDVDAPSLAVRSLGRRVGIIAAAAEMFEGILRRVNPSIAFVVNPAAGLGPAFVLACRRRGILSVDLQRCPRAGAPMAYGWPLLPSDGYATLPSVFWTWDVEETPHLPASRWHRDLHGGHAQIRPFLDDGDPATLAWDKEIRRLRTGEYAREILVALQPIGGQQDQWNALADVIETAPATWRWWIRRHPAMRPHQDAAFGRLLSLRGPNVVIDPPVPLPALLRHMSVLLSLASGAAVEASWFGVPVFFLSAEACGPFGALLASREARLIPPADVAAEIARLPGRSQRPTRKQEPALEETLKRLEAMARDHARLCAGMPP